MHVFLVPVGAARYQLYVEIAAEAAGAVAAASGADSGWVARMKERFQSTLAEAEADRVRRERGEPDGRSGLWQTIMRKIAEAIAEQRLLWHLRHQTVVDVVHPDDLAAPQALDAVRAEFQKDMAKHLRWLLIDGAIAAITGPVFFFVPGPNIISWYFTFRAVGHFLSWRGARRGLTSIEFRPAPSAPLTALRSALGATALERRRQLDEIARALGLENLTGFVERVAPRQS